MSASERLRALMEAEAVIVVRLNPTPLHVAGEPPGTASVTLRNALPLIADVVEAAEEQAGIWEGWNFANDNSPMGRLRNSLTALREHLKGGDE